jgi:hypothetical protein
MSKKLIGGLAVAVALGMAAPAWANGGHGHRHGQGNGYAYGHAKQWQKHPVRQHYVVREVYRPVYPRAVYPVYPVAAPGIHVVIPSIFIRFH